MTERSVDKKTQVRSTEEALKLIDLLVKQDILTKHETNLLREALMSVPDGAQSRSDEEQLAQQQEPVAWIDICEKGQMSGLRYWSEPDNRHEVPLYTSPPAQQQEPVAWMFTDKEGTEFFEQREDWEGRWTPLYTSPPASKPWVQATTWRGLTDEEIEDAWPFSWRKHESVSHFAIYHAIEAKLKAKNSL